jgi:hypothetical protein
MSLRLEVEWIDLQVNDLAYFLKKIKTILFL